MRRDASLLATMEASRGGRPAAALFATAVVLSVCLLAATAFAATGASAAGDTCPNAAVRQQQGASGLPDCRAYELVTPRNTNGAPPYSGVGGFRGFVSTEADSFSSPLASPGGDSYKFSLFATNLSDLEGTGWGNQYRAQRGPDGWTTTLTGPTGPEAGISAPGAFSADHGFTTFHVYDDPGRYNGSLDTGSPEGSDYLVYPDGTKRLLGEGTIPADPDTDGYPDGFADEPSAQGNWISPGGGHIIFSSRERSSTEPVKLLPEAPPNGVAAVYDRTPAGLRLISLLPGDVTPATSSAFEGASRDGSVVLFYTGSTLYARVDNTTTLPIVTAGESELLPGGVSDDGSKIFFAVGGNLFAYQVDTQVTKPINGSGDAEFVEVSADGSRVYFVSPSQLEGEKGTAGGKNLYVWDGSTTTFVATADPADFHRLEGGCFSCPRQGLSRWAEVGLNPSLPSPAKNEVANEQTSRLTEDGTVFAFESAAKLTSYENEGRYEIYLYRVGVEGVVCVSCDPTGDPPTADASFIDNEHAFIGTSAEVPNLTPDGRTVFFETAQALVSEDSNSVRDVYEWSEGDVHLISSGHSSQPSYLTGVSASGGGVFFLTADQLALDGQEPGVPGIYDARVNGGFLQPEGAPQQCEDDACQGEAFAPSAATAPGSSTFSGPGNQRARKNHHRKHHSCKAKRQGKKKCKQHRHVKRNHGGSK